ncbi:hypothetical protein [Viscerimonas tarda]
MKKFTKFTLLFAILLVMGNMTVKAKDYRPQVTNEITSNTIIFYPRDLTGAEDPETLWVVAPSYSKGDYNYTNLTGAPAGNPSGITDNLQSASSVGMMQIKTDGGTSAYNSEKRVVHMRVSGIAGVIVHGYTGSAGRGIAIGYNDVDAEGFSDASIPIEVATMTRATSGSCILPYLSFDPEKTYIISVYAAGGDTRFYAIEFLTSITTGISSADAEKVEKSAVYFDLQGRVANENAKGVLIKKTTYTDGSVSTDKVIK